MNTLNGDKSWAGFEPLYTILKGSAESVEKNIVAAVPSRAAALHDYFSFTGDTFFL
jgi:hypothetical protein